MEVESYDFNLRECLENVMDVFAGRAAEVGIELLYEIDHLLPVMIVGDGLRLRQILINLVSNAMKFTHRGQVFIQVESGASVGEELSIRFKVIDTGIGIPEDKQARLFKAFSQVDSSTTRKYGGTGLGLAISQRLVKLMGGEIGVKSAEGVGTTFYFDIKTRAAKIFETQDTNISIGTEGKRVLLVDDNETNLSILKSQLELWKLGVTVAGSGKEALSILEKDRNFHLIISDLRMPEMDGVQLAEAVKAKLPLTPIILLAPVGDESKARFPHLISHVLSKPVKVQQLFKLVQTELQQNKETAPEARAEAKTLSDDFAVNYPLHILIAEDNLVNQKLAMRVLNKLGYQPEIVNNGLEAVELLSDKSFDLILMDMLMPEMDGLEATRTIRKNGGEQPYIVAMTANALPEDREMCLQAGMDDYISKPIKLDILVNVLKEIALKVLEK